jgi:hypothetical protein
MSHCKDSLELCYIAKTVWNYVTLQRQFGTMPRCKDSLEVCLCTSHYTFDAWSASWVTVNLLSLSWLLESGTLRKAYTHPPLP